MNLYHEFSQYVEMILNPILILGFDTAHLEKRPKWVKTLLKVWVALCLSLMILHITVLCLLLESM